MYGGFQGGPQLGPYDAERRSLSDNQRGNTSFLSVLFSKYLLLDGVEALRLGLLAGLRVLVLDGGLDGLRHDLLEPREILVQVHAHAHLREGSLY